MATGKSSRFNDDVPHVGSAFEVGSQSQRDERKKLEVQDKLKQMADNDLKINGCYVNAPYKVIVDGERFTGKPKRVQVVTKFVLSITGRSNYAMPREEEFARVEIADPLDVPRQAN